MRILIVLHESEFNGGANRSHYDIILGLMRMSEVEVLLPDCNGGVFDALKRDNVKVHVAKYYKVFSETRRDGKNLLRWCNLYMKYIYNLWQSKRIARRLKECDFDVVYSNTRMTSIGWQIAHQLHVPHVMHIREFGHPTTIWGPCNIQRLAKESKFLICITKALKDYLSHEIKGDKLLVSYNGVFQHSYDGVLQHSFIEVNSPLNVLITGRITEAKRQECAIMAVKKLLDNGINVHLHLAGTFSSTSRHEVEYHHMLKDLVDKNSIGNNVTFHGEVSDMLALRGKMDIELLCADCETFGRVTVEGMRSGLLFIGTNAGGTPELAEDGKTGLLFAPGNVDMLVEKIKWALDNREEAEQIRKAGCIFARNHFKIEQNVNEVFDILCSAAQNKSKNK